MTLQKTDDLLAEQSYPVTAEELAERCGEHELTLPNGAETLEAVIERCGEETFESAFDAQQSVYSALSSKAIGRKGYSDRDPTPMGVDGHEPLSF
ncbi:DUF5789 family protein [Halanaeroarchaeum sulfurireducens]|uniref:DUF2795 domain-containing protein n=1 Tax=Halanaeroarchaeum sulfurireducens TaxID=1604004 RepID=A0A0F7PCV0_9EURY|nr:hypothetical protein [Halanaeroarchaeum sulfurireducens]AKH98552.1 hypothetical protein HLASF_2090 [Halanaeroarchaeum sulfurireducens]ALG82994.1 hypothetical protein HLASA_2124 [Halanaeroarchaeum sulfurireducens]